MNIKRFINRPILSIGISIFTLLLGLLAMFNLPIEQYPDIAPPSVKVSTSYTGASAATIQKSVIAEVYRRTAHITKAKLFITTQGMIPGYGDGGGFEFHTQDKRGGDIKELYRVNREYIDRLNARPEIAMAYSSYNVNYPQYQLKVDAAKAKMAGVNPSEVLAVIGGYYGGIYASNVNLYSNVYRVMVRSEQDTT